MDLPNLLNKLKNNSDEVKQFLAIEISHDTVKTAVWQSSDAHTEVVSVGSVQAYSIENSDDLLSAIDMSLADAETSANDHNQVIFGLSESWVEADGIVESKKAILKTICMRLGLKAIGFVVSTEAIAHYLRDIEGSPPSAILIRLSNTQIAISLVYLGQLVSTQIVERSATLSTDVEEGIARIPHTGHLPSRMILLSDSGELESIKQELISYDWQKRLEFLHIPKIESFTKDWSIRAVCVAGGSEVIDALGLNKPEIPSQEETPTDKSFGFTTVTLDEDSDINPPVESASIEHNQPDNNSDKQELINNVVIEEITETKASEMPVVPLPSKPLLLGFRQKITRLKPHFSLPKLNFFIPAVVLIIFIGIIAAGYFAYQTYPHAAIDINVMLNPFEQPLTFKVDPSTAATNTETLTLPGKKQTLEKTGNKTISTTGSKTVGERAKGKVTLYNRTTSSKTLPAGTTLKASNLRFTLDTNITIASASTKENADFSMTTEPSKVDANITAADIGDSYNLPKDTQFSVSNFSQDNFLALSITSISGGSSRKVAAVSKDDTVNIKQSLINELKQQISDSLPNTDEVNSIRQLPLGEAIISKENYSAKTGDEANELTLDLIMSQPIYEYDLNEIALMAQSKAINSLPADVQIKPDSTKVNILDSTIDENDVATVNATVTLQYIPRIDLEALKKSLINKPIAVLADSFQSIPNYQSYTLNKQWLIFNRLPINHDQIDLHFIPVVHN